VFCERVPVDVHDALHTRRLLLGHGWTIAAFARATGMTGVPVATDEHADDAATVWPMWPVPEPR
jgi:hypothetical protein